MANIRVSLFLAEQVILYLNDLAAQLFIQHNGSAASTKQGKLNALVLYFGFLFVSSDV
jgi:hypothetical protein